MPVTAEQAQMLTALALSCRPTGARRWDAAGVMANIRKVADRDLATVMIAVAQAAEDRNAETPGVIAAAGPHWRKPDPMQPTTTAPNVWDPDAICTTCSRPEAQCKAVRHADDDHPFISRAANAQQTDRPTEAVLRIVADLKERVATAEPAAEPERAAPEPNPHVQAARAALAVQETAPVALEGAT